MNSIIIGSFTILTYLASTFLIIKELLSLKHYPISIYLAWIAVVSHSIYNTEKILLAGGFNFSFFNTASLVSLLVVLILLVAAINKPVEKLGIALFPIAAIMLSLEMANPDKTYILKPHNWQMSVHILTSIVAFSLLNIAAFQAILLAIQERQLRSHKPQRLMQSLPPLQTMESLLFQMIASGLVFLSISLLSGFLFLEDLFAQHLAHKTVLSIIAWLIFCSLITGRFRFGWRGQTTINWTLIGFGALLLAYFGSKLVLEIILERA